jgi:class 3 adenylate cyclase
MHRELKQLLSTARGESHLVVVVFLDVRGFSSFAKIAESSEAALFLRSMYEQILDNYFPNAAFFKPTGDGLMIILDYEAASLSDVVNHAVASSISLVNDFPELTSGDPMINFEVPGSLGIGLARGAATALISDGKVLDYSGRPLNLASRLMDLARPQGVVFSDTLGCGLLGDDYLKQFTEEQVYVKGIAEDAPMSVHILSDSVRLPDASKRPINKYIWKKTETEELKLKGIRERSPKFVHKLDAPPAIPDDIRVHMEHPARTAQGRKHPKFMIRPTLKAVLHENQGISYAAVDYAAIAKMLTDYGVKETWPIKITIEYAVLPGGDELT